ncbi:DUF58 domain-containing protein [Pseudolysinimonas kribbensis]|uniref:DUF58 domain-containing protein n=1 Tax=Pseudolysinimonas kribbensis TaxID=433641 RepID=UPI0031DF09E5
MSAPAPAQDGRPGREGTSRPRSDTLTRTGTAGLTNTRTRLVGARQGVLADAVVSAAQVASTLRRVIAVVFARVAAVVTPLGWVMLAVIPLAFGFGYGLGWLELVAVAWAGVVLAAVAGLYLIGRSPFRVELALVHKRVVVGDPATGVVHLTNPASRRIAGVKVEVPVGAGLAEIAMPALKAGGRFAHEFAIPTQRRGLVPIGPVRTVRADPIGLVRREVVWTDRAELVVHPHTISVPSTSTGLIRDLEGTPTADLTSSDVSFHSLREFQTGDERRFIHWKSTAKAGTWMVRQFEQTRRSHLVVALSLAAADFATGEEFELAVSVAGSLGVRAIRDGRTVSVVVSALTPEYAKHKTLAVRSLQTHVPARLLDDLALVDPAQNAIGIRDLARAAAEEVEGISVAFLVCGSTPSPQSLRAASHSFPAGVGVVAIVCDPDATPGLRRVAGLSVLTIGYLDDLRVALQRTAAVA